MTFVAEFVAGKAVLRLHLLVLADPPYAVHRRMMNDLIAGF